MLYFATASGPRVCDLMSRGALGQIVTPATRNRLVPGVEWCGDNSAFAGKYPGDDAFLAWLAPLTPARDRCRFVAASDVVGDAAATLAKSAPMMPRIRAAGFPVALVAQNGLEDLSVPWGDFDALFLGGDTPWKLGYAAARLAAHARTLGKWVHMGRVNSWTRVEYARYIGCHSVDGTYLAFGPDINSPKLLAWIRRLEMQPTLFDA